jgi:hypothetical protein
MNTTTAKKVTRTLSRASPTKESNSNASRVQQREDIENLSAVTLAALGMVAPSSSAASEQRAEMMHTPQPSGNNKRVSKLSNGPMNEMYATPPVKSRTVSSSSVVCSSTNNNNNNSARTRDRTTTSSSGLSSDTVYSSTHAGSAAPLTAIRRPAPQSLNTPTTSSRRSVSAASASKTASKASSSPSSTLKQSVNGSSNLRTKRGSASALPSLHTPSTSSRLNVATTTSTSTNTAETAARQARRDRQHASKGAEEAPHDEPQQDRGILVSQEEYASLVALLTAKDDQITSLQAQVEAGQEELSHVKERSQRLQSERDGLLVEKREWLKQAAASSGSPTATANADGSISKREYEQFKKQYEMQENLLEGFQRENEKATVEIESLKKR